jgi:hypothetical protein
LWSTAAALPSLSPAAWRWFQIAKILGPAISESDLLSTFHLYLRDVDEVKVGVIQSLAAFLGALSEEYRCVSSMFASMEGGRSASTANSMHVCVLRCHRTTTTAVPATWQGKLLAHP